MNLVLSIAPVLAAILSAPDSSTSAAPSTPVPLRGITPPVPIPEPWKVAAEIAGATLLLALLIWLLVNWLRHRSVPPPSATAIALAELERLRAKVGEIEPYGFSVTVSDVLRTFISNAKFRLPATRLTSPEFLAAISGSQLFSEEDRSLLGRFLEKCDMIKFARIQATSSDNSELVESALAFVQGGRT